MMQTPCQGAAGRAAPYAPASRRLFANHPAGQQVYKNCKIYSVQRTPLLCVNAPTGCGCILCRLRAYNRPGGLLILLVSQEANHCGGHGRREDDALKSVMTGLALSALLALACADARANIVNARVEGNSLKASIELSRAASAELTISFEEVVGLSAESLGLSVTVPGVRDTSLLERLGSAAVSIPREFPVLVRIEPPETGGLSFSGVVTIELYTHNLQYRADTPLRLFSAELGGTFQDTTSFTGSGSFRTGARKGTFSEFMIVSDYRPLDTVVTAKFDRLGALLQEHGSDFDPSLQNDLGGLLTAAHSAYSGGAHVAAIQYIETLASLVREHAGSGIPNVWQSTREITNVAGELRAAADTLRYSLTLASNTS
ncbi:hypothetical protein BH24PSE2_BH24PSE2_03990 [soil metagenome]